MPVYDFRCDKCGHRFEWFASIAQRDRTACPRCGGPVSRVYEGKWALGARSAAGERFSSGGGKSGCSCGGNCAGCAGCGK